MKYMDAFKALLLRGLAPEKVVDVLNRVTTWEDEPEMQRAELVFGGNMNEAEADIFLARYEMTKPFVCEGRR